jgi:serine/threonine protein kinase/tetratricopeptide (TPR) repeat protein
VTPPGSADALITRLLALPVAERADTLARALAAEPSLRDHEAKISAALESASGFTPHGFSGPASSEAMASILESALEATPTEAPGTRIGWYQLVQEIGRGGFGMVWLAEQLEPIRRQVALKIIKLGMDTEEVITRFEAERQALARMEHPNIARVMDAGATASGRPYFVMELVRGIAITRYCDEHRLPAEARLRLFVAVCHAVEHAHQKGIVHRDLKPSNILVTVHDGVPTPKIIDFGIAKATQGRLTDRTLFTQLHSFLGTPAYASPEQMETGASDVDTRSDIYSLGVLLYQLLTGQLPFDPEALAQSGFETMRRTIQEIDPPRPSHRLSTLSAAERGAVAVRRGTDATKLSLQLRGDLDCIVMHCLEKSRERRYQTVTGLARDVEHFLAHEPVAARAPTATYRLGKLIRRHRLAFAAGTVTVLMLVAGTVLLSLMLLREREARRRETELRAAADASAQEARIAAAKSAQVAEFMKDMLNGVAPGAARGRDTAMLREIVDATAQKLGTELADQPAVAADLRDTLGVLYRDLGQYAAAEKLLRANVAARRLLNGNNSEELAATLETYAKALKYAGLPGVKDAMLEALAIRQKLYAPKDPRVVRSWAQLSHLAVSEFASFAEWEALRRKVLAMRLEIYGPEHPDVAESYFSLGTVANQRNDLAESARLYRQALDMRRKLLGPDHPEVTSNLLALGWTLSEDFKWAEASDVFREGLELSVRVLPEHPRVTAGLFQLAGVQPPVVTDDSLIALARAAVKVQRERLGPKSPSVAASMLALATLLDGRASDAGEARALVQEATTVLETNRRAGVGPASEIVAEMNRCAQNRIFNGAPAQALPITEQLILNSRAGLGPPLKAVPVPLLLSALANFYTGRPDTALLRYEESMASMQRKDVSERAHLSLFGAAKRESGRAAEGERLLRDGLEKLARETGDTGQPDVSIATIYCELGLTLNAQSRFAEAETCLRQSLDYYERADREKAPRGPMRMWQRIRPRAEAESGLGAALAGQGRFAEAEPLLVHAFEKLTAQREQLAGDRDKLLREATDRLVVFYTACEKPDRAAEWRARRPSASFVAL